MARSLFSGSTSPTVFYFPDGQEAGETFRIVQPGDDGMGSILARRYRLPVGDSIREHESFHTTADAYAWIAEGIGRKDAMDAYYDTPIAGLEIVEPAPEAAPAAPPPPPRTKKPAATPSAPSGRRPRAVTSSAD